MGKLNKIAWALLVCILVLTGCSARITSSRGDITITTRAQ